MGKAQLKMIAFVAVGVMVANYLTNNVDALADLRS